MFTALLRCALPLPMLKPGTLWPLLNQQTEYAIRSGALHSLETEDEWIKDGDSNFLVRTLGSLSQKPQQLALNVSAQAQNNPFLPYDGDLFVADLSPSHVGLLNKYNVVPGHLLIITREFERQETLLTLADFQALCACMAEFEGLAFFNAGKLAGASQPHKHLQLIPLPLSPQGPRIPLESVIATAQFQSDIGYVASWPFNHAIAHLEAQWLDPPSVAAEILLEHYLNLLQILGLIQRPLQGNEQLANYNLLATREWLLLVPRSQSSYQSIEVNALGFAGALLVRNAAQMQQLKQLGPLHILSQVGIKRAFE